MLSYKQKLQYKDALERVSKVNKHYKVARAILYLMDEYGFHYECVDEKALPNVKEKYKKSNYLFAVLEKYVQIYTRYKTKFDHKFFDGCYIKSFEIPEEICEKFISEYLVFAKMDKQRRVERKKNLKQKDEDIFTI